MAVLSLSCGHKKEEALKKGVQTVKVERKNISQFIKLTGSIEAKEFAEIFPRGPGKVIKKILKDGDPVKKDQSILLTMRDEVGFTFKPAPVVSTINGFVGRIFVDVGESVDVNTPVANVVQPSQMEVKIDMPESHIPDIKTGEKIEFGTDTLPGDRFVGTITSVSKAIDLNNRAARIEILVDNPDHKLVHGMFAKMELPLVTHENVICIPQDAVGWEAEKQFAYKVENGRIKKAQIKTGIRNTTSIEVTEGLNEGDIIAVADLINLRDGEEVNTVER